MQFLIDMKKFYTKNGRELELIKPAAGTFNVLVVGVIHGDEPQGKGLITNYLKKVKESRLGFIPVLNPDGLAQNTRTNANNVDLNRNFPATTWEYTNKNEYWGGEKPASEVETRFLINIIEEFKPKLILTLHAPYKVVNYDGNALVYAKEISKLTGYPVSSDIGYPTPGSFGTYAGIEKNIPVITLELDEGCSITELEPSIFKVFKYLETLYL